VTDTLRATRPDHADTTGIYVRAVGLNGRWGSHDIAELDAPSLLACRFEPGPGHQRALARVSGRIATIRKTQRRDDLPP